MKKNKTIRSAALDYLARREHSKKELTQKLLQAGFQTEDIKNIIHTLCAENLLSNKRFTENYINFRQKKGFGPLRITNELDQRGITTDEYVSHINPQDLIWFESAKKAILKRFKNIVPTNNTEKAKQIRFLQHRGFTQEQIKKSIIVVEN